MTITLHTAPVPVSASGATLARAVPHLPATARAVLDGHRDDATGMCGGCYIEFSQLKPAPCEQARWAGSILAEQDGNR